jgi:hypothetical protein
MKCIETPPRHPPGYKWWGPGQRLEPKLSLSGSVVCQLMGAERKGGVVSFDVGHFFRRGLLMGKPEPEFLNF